MEIEANKSYINRRLEVLCWYVKNEPDLASISYVCMKKIRNGNDGSYSIAKNYVIYRSSGISTENEFLDIHSSLTSHMSTNLGKDEHTELYSNDSALSDTFNLIFDYKIGAKVCYSVNRKLGETVVAKISKKRYELVGYDSKKIYGALISIKPTEKIKKIQDKFKNLSKSIEKGT